MSTPSRICFVMFAFLLWGCTSQRSAETDHYLSPQEPSRAGAPSQERQEPASERQLIWTVQLTLRADDTEEIAGRLQEMTDANGGFVASISSRRQQERLYYDLTLRVPTERLQEFLSDAKNLPVRVDFENVSSEDVTDQYTDHQAQLKTLQATETELLTLLGESRQRQSKAEDIMAIYRELTEIRSRIEQLQGRINVLGRLTALATIHVDLRPSESALPLVGDRWRPWETVRGSARTLVVVLQGLADLSIFTLIVLLPTAVIAAVPLWLIYRLWSRRRRRA